MFQARLKLGSQGKHLMILKIKISTINQHQPPAFNNWKLFSFVGFDITSRMVPFLNFNIICLIQVFLIKGEEYHWHFSWTETIWNIIEIWSQLIFKIEIRESCGKHHSDVHHIVEENYIKKSPTHFDFLQPQNVSAILGKTAFLTCVVKNLKPTQKVEYSKI